MGSVHSCCCYTSSPLQYFLPSPLGQPPSYMVPYRPLKTARFGRSVFLKWARVLHIAVCSSHPGDCPASAGAAPCPFFKGWRSPERGRVRARGPVLQWASPRACCSAGVFISMPSIPGAELLVRSSGCVCLHHGWSHCKGVDALWEDKDAVSFWPSPVCWVCSNAALMLSFATCTHAH